MMPAFMEDLQIMGLKVVSVFPGNLNTEYDSHMGTVMIFEAKHGQPLAIMDATEITAIRTAAVSGVATGLLARKATGDLAILGSALRRELTLKPCFFAERSVGSPHLEPQPENGRRFAERESRRHNMKVELMPAVQAAMRERTSSAQPRHHSIYSRRPISFTRCTHQCRRVERPFCPRVGYRGRGQVRLFVDRRESTVNEAGDFLIPQKGRGHRR